MLNAHRCQQLQRKSKTELALVDPVDKHLGVRHHALRFQAPGELLVRDVLGLSHLFDDGFGTRLVELARIHSEYMVFRLSASYENTFS